MIWIFRSPFLLNKNRVITIKLLTIMIKLTGINKIYRTNEIETVALENVNLEVNKGEFLSIMGLQVAANLLY